MPWIKTTAQSANRELLQNTLEAINALLEAVDKHNALLQEKIEQLEKINGMDE